MKKLAIRAGIVLAIVVALSMFFAQTIVTITTPKVKFAQIAHKKFEEKVSLSSELYFAKTDKITLEAASKTPVTVDKMYVRVGDLVAEGDTICTTRLSDQFSKEVDAASDALVKAREDYMTNETANIKLIDQTSSDKNEAYNKVNQTSTTLAKAQSDLLAAAAKQALVLPEDPAKWAVLIQEKNDPNLTQMMEDVLAAQSAATQANEAFLATYTTSKTKKEVYDFLITRGQLQKAMDKAQNALVQLVSTGEALTTIRAEHAGYIIELNLEEGKPYGGDGPAYVLNAADTQPVLRVDVSGIKREYAEGMRADIKGEYGDIRSSVIAIVREGLDKKFLHIELSDDGISKLGGIRALLGNTTQVGITYKAKENTTILPASVVRFEGDEKSAYIYVAEESYDGMWGSSMVARKMAVTVVDRGDKEISVREDLRSQRVIYQEDRAITDNSKVMSYVE